MVDVRPILRVSTDEQAAAGYSLAAQREKLQNYVSAQDGWRIVDWYVDDGYSGKSLDRPGIQRALRDMKSGDIVLVHKLDRLTRSVRDLETLTDMFDDRRVSLRSVNENIDTSTANGRLFMRLIIEVAQWEREQIAERTSVGIQKKMSMGEWHGGPTPFGYVAVPSGIVKKGKAMLKLVPDESTSHIVPMIFDRYRSGYGARAIATWLNDELGARTTAGTKFTTNAVLRILRNPFYYGDLPYISKETKELATAPGSHEALIDKATFDFVQTLLSDHKRYPARQATGKYPLSGVVACDVCGASLGVITYPRKSGETYYAYTCSNYAKGRGCANDAGKTIAAMSGRLAEEAVVSALAWLGQAKHVEAFLRTCEERVGEIIGVTESEIKRLNEDLAEAQKAIARWDKPYEAGQIEWDDYNEKTRPHRERAKAIKAKLAEYDGVEVVRPKREAIQALATHIPQAWAKLSPPERKTVLQQLRVGGVQIRLRPDKTVSFAFQP